mgnify:CR=1 FL=1
MSAAKLNLFPLLYLAVTCFSLTSGPRRLQTTLNITPSFPHTQIPCPIFSICDKFLFARSWIIKTRKVFLSLILVVLPCSLGCGQQCFDVDCLLDLPSSGRQVLGGGRVGPWPRRPMSGCDVMMSACLRCCLASLLSLWEPVSAMISPIGKLSRRSFKDVFVGPLLHA